jgi:hypothetical protein
MVNLLPFGTELNPVDEPQSADFALKSAFTLQSLDDARGFRLSTDDLMTLEHAELPPVLDRLRQYLMVHVANHAPDRVFVHAGVVGWRGYAILLPGPSFAGKTTLVAELVRAGATYYSDEYAVLDADGLVHPYARDLQMREPGRLEQRAMPIEALNGIGGLGPLPVGNVFFAEYMQGAHWQPQSLSPGLAALEMMRHAIPVQRTPARVMATLSCTMSDAKAWRSMRGEARETAEMILGTPQ